MKNMQKGFTLIELMIVVAIIGILAAIALPQYQDYIKKAKFAEVLSTSEAYKTPVGMCFQDQTVLTNCNAGANNIPAVPTTLPANVASMTVAAGVITATGTTAAGGYTSVLTPVMDGAVMRWTQTGTCQGVGYCK